MLTLAFAELFYFTSLFLDSVQKLEFRLSFALSTRLSKRQLEMRGKA